MRSRSSVVRTAFSAAAFFVINTGCAQAACGDTEQDRIVWARERMHPTATKKQLELVYQWLTNGTRSCSQSGDLWYYRSLAAKQLGDQKDSVYALGKAEENNSKAKADGFDPFTIRHQAVVSPPGRVREKFALIVGVSKLQESDDYLKYAADDAKTLSKFLIGEASFKQENVYLLTDKMATTNNIRETLGTIRNKAKPDDLVVAYFSSHGYPNQYDPTGISYVYTYDIDTTKTEKVFASALKMVELAEFGRWVQAHDYVLFLDTCYSGGAQAGVTEKTPSNPGGGDPLQGLAGSGHSIVLSASRADEKSYEDNEHKRGYFTRFLIEGMRAQKERPLAAVFDYVRDRVTQEVAEREKKEQHPVMHAYGQGGDIVLSAPLSAALWPVVGL